MFSSTLFNEKIILYPYIVFSKLLKRIVPSVVELGRVVVGDGGVDESEAVETELLFPLFPVMILSMSTIKSKKIAKSETVLK